MGGVGKRHVFQENTTPIGFYYDEDTWGKDCETIRRGIGENNPEGKKETRKAKNTRRKTDLHQFLEKNQEIRETLNKKIDRNEIRKAIRSLKNGKSFG